MNPYTRTEVLPRVPPLPPQLTLAIEEARRKKIEDVRAELDSLLTEGPLYFVYEYGVEVLGDVAESLCGARVCKLTGDTAGRWVIDYDHIEARINIDTVYEAFDPERANDGKRLKT